MSRLPLIQLVLALGALAACAEDRSPTQPESGTEPASPSSLAAALASNTWTLKAPGPALIGISAGAVADASGQSIVYVLGGTDGAGSSGAGVEIYKIGTNTWSNGNSDHTLGVYSSNGIGRIGNTLYISGGESYLGGSWHIHGGFSAYNTATHTLTDKALVPKVTATGVTGVIDGKLYVLPGRCSTDYFPDNKYYCETEPFRRLFRYNPATNLWATKRSAPHYHANGAGGVIDGKFYVAGGLNNYGSQPEASLDRYGPATDTWTTLAPLPTAGAARGAVIQGKLLVVVRTTTGRRAYAFDPATNKWTAKAAPRWDHDDIVPITWGGKPFLLAVGGVHYDVPEHPYLLTGNPTEVYAP